jgi:hypothetical protein
MTPTNPQGGASEQLLKESIEYAERFRPVPIDGYGTATIEVAYVAGYRAALSSQVVRGLVEALKHADAACTYAFDDYGDRYYANVAEIIIKAKADYEQARAETVEE